MTIRKGDVIERLRSLMPIATLLRLSRTLTRSEARVIAERQANMLLRLLHIRKPGVEVELVAELPQVKVEFLPNLCFSGSSVWKDGYWHIHINADDSLWRCRATLAHELKHILDDPYAEVLYPECGVDPKHTQNAEAICDYFAGCVLVPRRWLKSAWQRGICDTTTLASIFNVSDALIKTRIKQVGLTARDKKSDWANGSRHRDNGLIHKASEKILPRTDYQTFPEIKPC
ncbi:ImmA/IrrE family metallo-endopeptidase [Streptomyces broussonetiae]|uniref:ImmA/IrrE family metallo-endopeptidase n=1 Tax=Streptomyces broussonetiae TaxID=2686304 RepID=A0ABV5EK35_9ACTN